ncbi:hypothetical protein [Streptomyces doebereineriae]|uniref:Uncharacterized protein n=1 Tax=Streptomyces doebereineriae TaxID=3075528 RepID=A0ABU2V1R4_9ACTN|nr:hypothetical protein [Streptomyces sp. DSM 41640]MDT0479496.1 hypothetical protein [Streptomyces sp. DSM 41640]
MNDEELLARMRAIDPARTSDAPQPDINRLLEATMTADTTVRTSPRTSDRPRRPLLMAAAAAAVLTVGAGITWGVTATRDTPPAVAAPLALTVQQDTGGGPATACAELDVTTLRQYTTAFEGTATSIDGDQITLRVDHWYRGEDASTVRLDNTHEGQLESFGQEFAVGQTYLVYAKDGKVPVCYGDAEATPKLRSLYDRAFRQ